MTQTTIETGVRQWTIDPSHSEVTFSVRHLMISTVRGNFTSVSGTATFDPQDIEGGSVDVEIDVASIDTGDENRDGHLRSGDFFDVENHPAITFNSTTVRNASGNQYEIAGDLTILGTTKPVTLQAEFTDVVPDPFGGYRVGVSAETSIDRTEFGLTWNQALETGGFLVGDEVTITLEVQLVKSETD